MTQAIPEHYALAQERIALGRWAIDPEQGHVLGVRRQPFRRVNSWGYIQIKFRRPGNWQQEVAVLAHRVIWEHVHGPLTPELTINHRNGIKTDNRLANLEVATGSENVHHAYRTGLMTPTRGHARLTESDVREIMAQADTPVRQVASAYGVDRTTINGIRHGWTWNHVTGLPQARSPK